MENYYCERKLLLDFNLRHVLKHLVVRQQLNLHNTGVMKGLTAVPTHLL